MSNIVNGRKIIVPMDSDAHSVLGAIATMKGFRNQGSLVKDMIAKEINQNKDDALEYLRKGAKASAREPEKIILPNAGLEEFLKVD